MQTAHLVFAHRCRWSVMLLALAACVLLSPLAQASTYYTVDDQVGGVMHLDVVGSPAYAAGVWTINLKGTNTGAAALQDVHLVQQFVWDFPYPTPGYQTAYSWDDTAKLWRNGDKTLTTYGISGQNGLMSMNRAIVDTPLSWTLTLPATGDIATVQVTDSLPALSLGDFAGGEVKNFAVYMAAPAPVPFDTVAFFVAVPEPSSLALMIAGIVGIAALAWRRARPA